jgi:hypothetical protein
MHVGNAEKKLEARTVAFPQRQDGCIVTLQEEVQPVITSIVADFMMRAKLTLWRTPAALVNGGWCSCLTRENFERFKVLLNHHAVCGAWWVA